MNFAMARTFHLLDVLRKETGNKNIVPSSFDGSRIKLLPYTNFYQEVYATK